MVVPARRRRCGSTRRDRPNRDVTVVSITDSRRLVWAVIDWYADGQGEGPVALVEIEPQGLAVRAMGVLRAYPENPSLRLARLGSGTVLVADGEYCAKPASLRARHAHHAARGRPLHQQAARRRQERVPGPGVLPDAPAGVAHGRKRAKYEISVSITYGPDNMSVREQLGLSRRRAGVGHGHRLVRDARAVGAAGDVEGREPGGDRAVHSRALAGPAAAALVERRRSQGLPSPNPLPADGARGPELSSASHPLPRSAGEGAGVPLGEGRGEGRPCERQP